ncbi:MAG: glycoside hydrolase family 16 protein [Oscillospiraceae bacterium]|nr:glycoside hydrolase family 16 protein [Oscillospiraceae bacterium]
MIGSCLLGAAIAVTNFVCTPFGAPELKLLKGEKMTLPEGYQLVWSDDFDGDALDRTKWDGHNFTDGRSIRRNGEEYWNMQMASVKDGNLHIALKYFADGLDGGGAGWYSAGLSTNGRYMPTYGYYEIRAILPDGNGTLPAFWLQSNAMGNVDGSGRDGSEIDIMECASAHKPWPYKPTILNTIHFDGYGDGHQEKSGGFTYIPGNPFKEYHTYGLLWTPTEYVFYTDGIETWRTDFGGVSQNPEYLILSLHAKTDTGHNPNGNLAGWCGHVAADGKMKQPTDFIVDYVRVYQLRES